MASGLFWPRMALHLDFFQLNDQLLERDQYTDGKIVVLNAFCLRINEIAPIR